MMNLSRREFLIGAGCASLAFPPFAALAEEQKSIPAASGPVRRSEGRQSELITEWDKATEEVSPQVYGQYLLDGDTRGFPTLDALERAFAKVLREAKETVVTGDAPAVWSVYNMGYIVKTRESLFAIDLNHRRGTEFTPFLDFALITHNHSDHWRKDFYVTMTGQGKVVASNFLKDNPGFNAMKGESAKGVGTYRIRDVEIRTSLIDHGDAPWAIDFTMAFEIKIGGFLLYHTGDSGRGTVPKLNTVWGRPDLWLFFPGCGINTVEAVKKIDAKRIVFGHLWELGHEQRHRGRLDERLIRPRLAEAKKAGCKDLSVAFWGDRIV